MKRLSRGFLTAVSGAVMLCMAPLSTITAGDALETKKETSSDVGIDKLVSQLGADEFAVRERATKALSALGSEALPILRTALERAQDREMKIRLKLVVETLLQEHSELHVIGVYQGKKSKIAAIGAGIVNVRVTARKNPLVIALTSYEPVQWRLETAEGVNIERVILSGYHDQTLVWEGPRGRVANHTLGTRIGDPRRFDAYKKGTKRFNLMEEKLRRLTNMSITRFYGAYEGFRFVIDDRPAVRHALKDKNVEMQVVGVYQGTFRMRGFDTVDVVVKKTRIPLVLVLCAYKSVMWRVSVDEKAKIEHIIVSGIEEQRLDWNGPIERVHNFSSINRSKATTFYATDKAGETYRLTQKALLDLTGLSISRFHGAYTGKLIEIDDHSAVSKVLKGKEFTSSE